MSQFRRAKPDAGFSILEAMIAAAILSAIAIVVLPSFSATAARQAQAIERYHAMEAARSLLEEYIATFPNVPETGTYAERWEWQIVDEPEAPKIPTTLTKKYDLRRVTISVAVNDRVLATLDRALVRAQAQ